MCFALLRLLAVFVTHASQIIVLVTPKRKYLILQGPHVTYIYVLPQPHHYRTLLLAGLTLLGEIAIAAEELRANIFVAVIVKILPISAIALLNHDCGWGAATAFVDQSTRFFLIRKATS